MFIYTPKNVNLISGPNVCEGFFFLNNHSGKIKFFHYLLYIPTRKGDVWNRRVFNLHFNESTAQQLVFKS